LYHAEAGNELASPSPRYDSKAIQQLA